MKVQVERLRYALQLVKPVIRRKVSMPILRYVRLGEGKLVACDLETYVTVSGVGDPTDEPVCLPYGLLSEMLASVPGYLVAEVILQGEGGKSARLVAGKTAVGLNTQPAEDFPPLAAFTPDHDAAVDGDALVRALSAALPYAAVEDSRPVLTAVCLSLGEEARVAGADGFRLRWVPAPKLPGEGRLLVPRHTVEVMGHLWKRAPKPPAMEDVSDIAHLAVAKRLLRLEYTAPRAAEALGPVMRVTFGDVCLVARCTAGTYPSYDQLIPRYTPSVSFSAPEFLRALRLVGNLARDGSGIVRLSWAGSELAVKARAEDAGSAETAVSALVHKEGRIAFTLKYLMEYFGDKDGMVTMATDSPGAPGLFSYRGVPEAVIMPMFVSEDAPKKAEETKDSEEAQMAEANAEAEAAQQAEEAEEVTVQEEAEPAPEPVTSAAPEKKRRSRRKKA